MAAQIAAHDRYLAVERQLDAAVANGEGAEARRLRQEPARRSGGGTDSGGTRKPRCARADNGASATSVAAAVEPEAPYGSTG
jgi:hypothetical protein